MFGFPGLDAGLNTSRVGGDIAIPIGKTRRIFLRLVYATSSQVLGPLLFNIYINDMFLGLTDTEVCNYADDTTLYACNKSLQNVVNSLERDKQKVVTWFPDNYMRLNEEKCHLMTFNISSTNTSIHVGNAQIKESSEEKLLGVTLDKHLTFKPHVSNLCKKAIRKFMSYNLGQNSWDKSQYCTTSVFDSVPPAPLVSMLVESNAIRPSQH